MPFVPVPNTALVEVRLEQDLQRVENTLWFLRETPWAVDALLALNNYITAWWIDTMSPLVSNTVSLREVACTDMASATGPQVTLPPPLPQDGQNTAPALPNNVTISVSFRTAQRGRSFRGRNYFIGLTEADVVANTVIGVQVTAIQDAYEELLTVGDTVTGVEWVAVSRFSGVDADGDPIPRVTGISTPIISVTVVDPIIDSQRRRLPARGT